MTNPLKTILIIIFVGCIIETFVVEVIDLKLKLNTEFTIADMILLGVICLSMGAYCIAEINYNNKQREIKEL